MAKILIVEDEKPISDLIRISLGKAGHHCECAFSGGQAAEILESQTYDLILLDVMLPEISGFDLMDEIRPLGVPVIFLTAKRSLQDRLRGLRIGAEDYIVKPFEVLELQARVNVVLRRFRKDGDVIGAHGVTVDLRSMRVTRGDAEIILTPKEYELLVLFLQNPNTALYLDTIYERVWGGDMDCGSKTVSLHVQRLRKKVGWEKELQSVSKVGYRLEVK